jgi:hypothetical protein
VTDLSKVTASRVVLEVRLPTFLASSRSHASLLTMDSPSFSKSFPNQSSTSSSAPSTYINASILASFPQPLQPLLILLFRLHPGSTSSSTYLNRKILPSIFSIQRPSQIAAAIQLESDLPFDTLHHHASKTFWATGTEHSSQHVCSFVVFN